jgi:hypothetical protein
MQHTHYTYYMPYQRDSTRNNKPHQNPVGQGRGLAHQFSTVRVLDR